VSLKDKSQRGWPKALSLQLGLLVVATLLTYFPITHHPFVNYDDGPYVINNPYIKGGLDRETITWAFTTTYEGNWHPLTWLSHALDFQLFQLDPAGHHTVNLLLHVLNLLLLAWIMWRATGWAGRGVMVAALFALHPINVESVAWIAERKNVLSMLFFLLGLGTYCRYARRPRPGLFVLVTLFYWFSLMAKPQSITFPFVLLLWDWWPLRRIGVAADEPTAAPREYYPVRNLPALLVEKIPLFVLCAISTCVTVVAQRAGGAMSEIYQYPFLIRVGNALVSYARYVWLAVFPWRLAPLYPHPATMSWGPVLASLVLLATVSTLAIFLRHDRPYLLVGWLWFLGALVPMIGIVQVGGQAMADRYAYLPFIGLFIMATWTLADQAEKYRLSPNLRAGASVALLSVFAALTYRQVRFWDDNVTLWSHTLQVTGNNYVAEDNLAAVLMDEGRTEEALKHFQAAQAIFPSEPTSAVEMANYYQQHGLLREAIIQYDKALPYVPAISQKAELLTNRGYVYGALKDYERAGKDFQEAVELNPKEARAWMGLGVVAQRSGNLPQAIDDYRRCIAAKASDVAYLLLARALQQSGRTVEAEAAIQSARLISQNLDQAQKVADGLVFR
jgi:tetratricopeptide (TPR) repeat protein